MKYEIDCSFCDREFVESDTVLAALADNRILSVTPIDPQYDPDNAGKFRVAEMCDNYFSGCLTADQLRALGQELIAIADSSNPTSQALRSNSLHSVVGIPNSEET